MKWQELSGAERYRVVELARTGQADKAALCREFGMSRQALNRAIKAAELGAQHALEPRPAGRKGKSAEQAEVEALRQQKQELEAKLKRAKQKYDIAHTFLELERKLQRGEPLPGEKEAAAGKKRSRGKPRWRKLKSQSATPRSGPPGAAAGMAGTNDGGGDGPAAAEPAPVAGAEDEAT